MTQLNACLALSQSALSQHLSVLRQAGVIETRRQSQTLYDRLCQPQLIGLSASLSELSRALSPPPIRQAGLDSRGHTLC